MGLVEMFLEYWWVIVLVMIIPYFTLFFSNLYKIKQDKKNKKVDPRLVQSDEQIHLGISIKNTDTKIYKERIENLIILLNESKEKISVNAVEAILIVELFSDSVLVNEQGELVISIQTAKAFSKEIYHDPMKFITYVKSVENRIDMTNSQNKIELSDVLYMMRNAKKFGLYMNEDDSDVVFKIKSAIHESNYKDVVVKIVEDINQIVQNDYAINNIVLNNTYRPENLDEPERDSPIEKIEKINENGRVKLTMKNGTLIEKDDYVFYSVQTLEQRQEAEQKNVKKTNHKEEHLTQILEQANDTFVQEYIARFGELDLHEEANKEKRIFKDRALKFYDENIFAFKNFTPKDFQTKSFFEDEKFYLYFIAMLFKKEFAVSDDGIPFVFIGSSELKSGKVIRFVSVDVYYFLILIYSSIKREDRESFFNFIFDGKKIKDGNVNLFFENINKTTNFFHPTLNVFIFDIVYEFSGKTIATKIINVSVEALEDLLDKDEDIRNAYAMLKKEIDGSISVKAFNKAALKITQTDIKYSHDTFFRLPRDEKIF
ncbi:hypothetical protein [Sulfurimonas sp.]|uniref:hypothetical protein n=1 Tax=Sulfurimonas sp. TaxID=2022749 RepID=UPI0025D2239E|nr:hypothetical protein [Sulfurimonas sp.]MBW6487465.1 hypothetical protein [Sulfurimonas sp.]